jgi:plasmid rolling circle replication initiator protein Rep
MQSVLKNTKKSKVKCKGLDYSELKTSQYQTLIYDFSELQKLSEHKNNQAIIKQFYAHFDGRKQERCESCSRVVVFARLIHLENGEQKLEIREIHTCQLRFCSVCAWRRQLKFAKLTHDTLKIALEQMKIRFIFLTLTVKNPRLEDLNETVKHMQASFKRMAETKKFKTLIQGYCRVFEITKPKCASEQGNIHPHFHVLLAVKPSYFNNYKNSYLTKDDYAEMWRKALRVDYTPVCDVRVIKPKTKGGEVVKDTTAAIAELVKYPLKDTDLKRFTWQEFKVLDEQMTRVRAINYGGILKEANKKDIDEIELDTESLEVWKEVEQIIMQYHAQKRKYIAMESNKRGKLNKRF